MNVQTPGGVLRHLRGTPERTATGRIGVRNRAARQDPRRKLWAGIEGMASAIGRSSPAGGAAQSADATHYEVTLP